MIMFGPLFFLAKIILGVIGLAVAINCARGLLSREGSWDAESGRIMLWSQLLGIVAGLYLFAWGSGLLRLLAPVQAASDT